MTETASEAVRDSTVPSAPSARDSAFLRTGFETIAVLLATCGYSLVYYGFRSPSGSAHASTEGLVAKAVQDVGITLLLLVLTGAKPRATLLPSGRRDWLREAWWGLLIAGGMWAAALATPSVAHWFGLKSGPSYWATSFRYPGVVATFLATVPFSCVRQELLYRYYFQPRFATLLGGKEDLAILLVSWIFAAVHGYPASTTLGVFISGLILGFVYRFSRRVPRLVFAHVLFNVAACLVRLP